MAPVDGKVSLSLCQMLESEKKAAAAAPWLEAVLLVFEL